MSNKESQLLPILPPPSPPPAPILPAPVPVAAAPVQGTAPAAAAVTTTAEAPATVAATEAQAPAATTTTQAPAAAAAAASTTEAPAAAADPPPAGPPVCAIGTRCREKHKNPTAALMECAAAGCERRIHKACYEFIKKKLEVTTDIVIRFPGVSSTAVGFFCKKACRKRILSALEDDPPPVPTRSKRWDDNELSALLQWITTDGNYARWTGEQGETKQAMAKEIAEHLLRRTGIPRDGRSVENKMTYLDGQFQKACEWVQLEGRRVWETEGTQAFRTAARKICPVFFEFLTIKGISPDGMPLEALTNVEPPDETHDSVPEGHHEDSGPPTAEDHHEDSRPPTAEEVAEVRRGPNANDATAAGQGPNANNAAEARPSRKENKDEEDSDTDDEDAVDQVTKSLSVSQKPSAASRAPGRKISWMSRKRPLESRAATKPSKSLSKSTGAASANPEGRSEEDAIDVDSPHHQLEKEKMEQETRRVRMEEKRLRNEMEINMRRAQAEERKLSIEQKLLEAQAGMAELERRDKLMESRLKWKSQGASQEDIDRLFPLPSAPVASLPDGLDHASTTDPNRPIELESSSESDN